MRVALHTAFGNPVLEAEKLDHSKCSFSLVSKGPFQEIH